MLQPRLAGPAGAALLSGANSPETTLSRALGACRQQFIAVGVFSGVVNLLQLTVSLYMMQVFDRVLSTRSLDTLLYLTLIAIVAAAGDGAARGAARPDHAAHRRLGRRTRSRPRASSARSRASCAAAPTGWRRCATSAVCRGCARLARRAGALRRALGADLPRASSSCCTRCWAGSRWSARSILFGADPRQRTAPPRSCCGRPTPPPWPASAAPRASCATPR